MQDSLNEAIMAISKALASIRLERPEDIQRGEALFHARQVVRRVRDELEATNSAQIDVMHGPGC